MANIFREAWNVITSRWRGGGTSKKEAETIMKNIGVLEEDDDLEEDYVFDFQNWKEPINNLEMWDGYTVGEYGQDFVTSIEVVATVVGLGELAVGLEALKASGASEEVAKDALEVEVSSNDVVSKWVYLLPVAVILLFVL